MKVLDSLPSEKLIKAGYRQGTHMKKCKNCLRKWMGNETRPAVCTAHGHVLDENKKCKDWVSDE